MSKTKLEIKGKKFYINGKPTYSTIENSNKEAHGLLMNARFIQGIFDDKEDRSRFNRFGRKFDQNKNTDDLIKALPEWYNYGLRAFTVGFQGGGPCFTTGSKVRATINNNPFSSDGKEIDPEYLERMDRLITAADELGMVVIVSYFYWSQTLRIKTGNAVVNAVKTASNFLRDKAYTNVIIEIANEHNVSPFGEHHLIRTAEGVSFLIDTARKESGGLATGSSGSGGYINQEVAEASDVVIIHANKQTRQKYYNMVKQVREWEADKPILCNEDSQAIGQLKVAYQTRTSWGYYNNLTKQEPPVEWGITEGEDKFFAYRMAEGIGIEVPALKKEEQYYLQGFEDNMEHEGKRWIRLASLYPETIDYVEYYRDKELEYVSYDEPFSVNFKGNWTQGPSKVKKGEKWKAIVHLVNGEIIVKEEML